MSSTSTARVKATSDGDLVSLEFASKEVMAEVLGRVSAFSENKEQKGQVSNSTATQSRGYFGHNFPMATLREFLRLNKDKTLTSGEKELLGLLKKQGLMDKSYLIAYLKNDYHTKMHEMQHARYYLDAAYRESVQDTWETLPPKQQKYVTDFLNRLGYHPDVHLDEFQAYHFTERSNFWGMKIDFDLKL